MIGLIEEGIKPNDVEPSLAQSGALILEHEAKPWNKFHQLYRDHLSSLSLEPGTPLLSHVARSGLRFSPSVYSIHERHGG